MTAATPIVLERENVNDESVVLVRWFVKHGDNVQADTLLAEVETSKANIEVLAPHQGFLVWNFPEGAEVPVSAPLGFISAVAPTSFSHFTDVCSVNFDTTVQQGLSDVMPTSLARPELFTNDRDTPSPEPEFPTVTEYRQRISPAAEKMMEAHGLIPADFVGKSIVREQDVLDLLNPSAALPRTLETQLLEARTQIAQPYRQVDLSKMKLREGRSLANGVKNAVQSAVSVTCFTQGMRRSLDARTTDGNASAVIVYEVSRLLRKYPVLNATYWEGTMLEYEQVNLGFAMDDGRGLKVAVLPNCDTLSLQQVSAELRKLTLAYVGDKLVPAQISNATFTISDVSSLGISSLYPLISENQGGILGIGGEQFFPNTSYGFYSLTLAFDHQLCEGRTAALFLNDLKMRLQSYEGSVEGTKQEIACSECGRTASQLAALSRYLLRSASPDGYLCTLCAAGH